jgi:large subunit ribosomal protein L4
MKISVLNQKGDKVKDIELSGAFEKKVSKEALALYIDYLRNSVRGAVANTKDRRDVSGGGKKPYKQKGTGRARQGSSRSPLWVGGGVTFGPTSERNFQKSINKSLKRSVIAGTLGESLKSEKAVVIDNLAFAEAKTKAALEVLTNLKAEGKISVILHDKDTNADMSLRNVEGIIMMKPGRYNLIDLISSNRIIISEEALKEMETALTK